MKIPLNHSNELIFVLLLLMAMIHFSCTTKKTSALEKEPPVSEQQEQNPSYILSELAKDRQFNTICDFTSIKSPSKDSSNKTQIITNSREINKRIETYQRKVLANYTLQGSITSYSLVEDLNKLHRNKALSEDEFCDLFIRSGVKEKNELLRRLTFDYFQPLKAFPKFQEVLKAHEETRMNDPKTSPYPYWGKIMVGHQLEGYKEVFYEQLKTYDYKKFGLSEIYAMLIRSSLEHDEELFKEGCQYILDKTESFDYYSTLEDIKILDKLLATEKHYAFSLTYIKKILHQKTTDLDKYHKHVSRLSDFLEGRIQSEDWEQFFEKKTPLSFASYEKISEDLTFTEDDIERNNYSGAISIKSMTDYQRIENALHSIVEILQNNSLDDNQKKIIREDLIQKRTNLVYGYLEPLVAICFFYAYPEMDKATFDQIFKTHQQREPYLKLWKVKHFTNDEILNKAIELGLSEKTEMAEKLFASDYAFSAFPFDDHAFKTLMEKQGYAMSYDADFGRSPVPYDNMLIDYLEQLGDQMPPAKVLMVYKKPEDRYVYELSIIAEGKMYTCQSDENGYLLSNMRKLINTLLEDIGQQTRLVSIETEDTGVFELYCLPDRLIDFYNHFQMDLCDM